MKISDLHLSVFSDSERVTEFREFCDVTVKKIDPSIVLASGDLTDAKTQAIGGSKQILDEWKMYKNIVNETGITNGSIPWLDIRGNHGKIK